MNAFRSALSRTRRLLIAQRTLRWLVRASWMGMSGYLIACGLGSVFGWFPEERGRLIAGALFALPAVAAAFRPLRISALAWRMDRLLGLREQVAAAWQVTGRERHPNPIELLLIEESTGLLLSVQQRIARKGWYLIPDVESLLITGVLLLAVIFSDRASQVFTLPEVVFTGLPALESSPAFGDVFPSGIPGLSGPAPGGNPGSPAAGDESPGDLGAISNILYTLGEALSDYPETAAAGDALQNGDLEGAASAIERTADNVDLLPEDARRNMQGALQQAARQAQEAGQEDLAEDLEAAAQALQNPDPSNPVAADALDDLADRLRDLGDAFAAMGQPGASDEGAGPENEPPVGSAGGASGSGSGAGGGTPPEPLTRLEGKGEDFTLAGGESPSGLLQPGSSPGGAVTTGGGTLPPGAAGSAGSREAIDSVLTPYSFPWRWRDVVSDYFSP